jgi:hypothetical protein
MPNYVIASIINYQYQIIMTIIGLTEFPSSIRLSLTFRPLFVLQHYFSTEDEVYFDVIWKFHKNLTIVQT